MIINQKIKLVLTKEDKNILNSQSFICNKLYNLLLEECIKDKENEYSNNYLSGRNLRDLVVKIKQQNPYMYSVHSSPLKNVAFRLQQAFKDFFNIEERGFPKFRSNRVKWFSLLYDEPNKGIKTKGKDIKISLGYKLDEKNNKKIRLYVNAKLSEDLKEGIIRNYRITKEKNDYYLIICIDYQYHIKLNNSNNMISIDPNHTNFFVGVDNKGKTIEFENLYMIKYFDKEIDKVKSKRDKCLKKSVLCINEYGKKYYKSSRRYMRLDKALNNLYLKRESQIKTVLYTIANKLCNRYSTIAIGNYVPSLETSIYNTMHRAMLNQTIIGKFRNILKHVCNKRGTKLIIVDEYHTTKECFCCKDLKEKNPQIRTYECPICKKKYNRDINSAINIGIKANILSGSDYIDLDLSKPMYIARYNLRKSIITY